jgi:hypothetical protein
MEELLSLEQRVGVESPEKDHCRTVESIEQVKLTNELHELVFSAG